MKFRNSRLGINGVWAVIGNVTYAFSQWFMLAAIVKLGGAEMAGHFGYALAVTAPIYLMVNMQLRSMIATDQSGASPLIDYLALKAATSAIAFLACAAFSIMQSDPLRTVLLLTAACKFVESLSEIMYGDLQKRGSMKEIAISQSIRGFGSALLLSCMLVGTKDLRAGMAGVLAVWVVVFLAYDFRKGNVESFNWTFRWSAWKPIFKVGIPLGFVLMLVSMVENIPRYVLEHYHEAALLGIFTAISYFRVASAAVINGICQAAAPSFAKMYHERRRTEFSALCLRLLAVVGLIGALGLLAAWLIGDWLLALFYDRAFASYGSVFMVVMLSAMLSHLASVFGTIMTATRIISEQFLVYGTLCAGSAIAAVALIPSMGVIGAAYVLLLSSAFQLALTTWITLRVLRKRKFVEATA